MFVTAVPAKALTPKSTLSKKSKPTKEEPEIVHPKLTAKQVITTLNRVPVFNTKPKFHSGSYNKILNSRLSDRFMIYISGLWPLMQSLVTKPSHRPTKLLHVELLS